MQRHGSPLLMWWRSSERHSGHPGPRPDRRDARHRPDRSERRPPPGSMPVAVRDRARAGTVTGERAADDRGVEAEDGRELGVVGDHDVGLGAVGRVVVVWPRRSAGDGCPCPGPGHVGAAQVAHVGRPAGSTPPSPSRAWRKITRVGLVEADLVGERPVVEQVEHPVAGRGCRRSIRRRGEADVADDAQASRRPPAAPAACRPRCRERDGQLGAARPRYASTSRSRTCGSGSWPRCSSTSSAAWWPVNCSLASHAASNRATACVEGGVDGVELGGHARGPVQLLGHRGAAGQAERALVRADQRLPEVEGDGVDAGPSGHALSAPGRRRRAGRPRRRRRPRAGRCVRSNTDGMMKSAASSASDDGRGDGAGRRQLHVLGDGGGPGVERAPEDAGEAQHVVDLVREVAAPGGHDRHDVAGGLLGPDLRIGVGQGEHDGVLGHGQDVARG